jgi:hypothetical protein
MTFFKEFFVDLERGRFDYRKRRGVMQKPNLVGQHHYSAGGTSDLLQ